MIQKRRYILLLTILFFLGVFSSQAFSLNRESLSDFSSQPMVFVKEDSSDIFNIKFDCGLYTIADIEAEIRDQSTNTPSCFGGNDGKLRYQISNSKFKNIVYQWTGPSGEDVTPQSGSKFDLDNLVAGDYILNVTVKIPEGNTCTYQKTITIDDAPKRFTINSSNAVTNVSCAGNDGAIDLEVEGANNPANLSYEWISGPAKVGTTTQDISGLPAGDYEVKIVESGSPDHCEIHKFTVGAFTAIAISSSTTDPSCTGASSGSIDLTVSGGTAPYTYSWTNTTSTDQDPTNLAAGSYTVTVTDANNCTQNATVTLSEPAGALSLSSTQVNVNCKGGSDGSIDLSASGGVAPYTYSWSNGTTTQDVSALTQGTYTVTVTDANGCAVNSSITVTEPNTTITADETVTNVSCNGGSDGAINLAVNNAVGTPTFEWKKSGVITGGNTQNLTGITVGNYSVKVTDDNGCIVIENIVITEPTVLTATATKTDILCNGATTGTVSLTVSGGTAPYSYSWSGPSGSSFTVEDLSSLTAGTYSVTVTDNNGCTATASATIDQPAQALAIGNVVTDVSCQGAVDGGINLTVAGGTGPYTYSWSNGATSEDLSTIGAGNYTVNVTDQNGCAVSSVIAVAEPASDITASFTKTDISCNGANDGAIDVSVSNTVGAVNYSWTKDGAAFSPTSEDLTGLSAGVYSVQIRDNDNCVSLSNITIAEPAVLLLSTTKTDVLCKGEATGSIDLSVTGGTGPFTYAWDDGVTTQDRTGLLPGTYSVTVTDVNGCTSNTLVTISEPTAALTINNSKVDVTCNGASDGSVNISVSGGVGAYTYAWSNGATTEDLSDVSAGSYTVNVSDQNGCTISANVTVTEPETAMTASYVKTDVTCNGATSGVVNITIGNATAPVTYLWSNGDTSEDLTNVGAGTYSVTVTDANGCITISDIEITQPDAISVNSTLTDILCNGQTNGAINLTVTGGVGPYTYSWSNGATTEDLTALSGGTYNLTLTDANGCTVISSYTINEPAPLTASLVRQNVSCFGANDGQVVTTVTGGTAPYNYLWSNGQSTKDVSTLSPGSYTLDITDNSGCKIQRTVQITQPLQINLNTNVTPSTCGGGADGAIDLSVTGGQGPYTYSWSNGAITQDLTGLSFGIYTAEVTDASGCTSTLNVSVNEDSSMNLDLATTRPGCTSNSDGALNLTVTGGTAPYNYSWSNGAVTEDLSNLTEGTYTITVTDATGCRSIARAELAEREQIQISSSSTNIACFGDNNGTVSFRVVNNLTYQLQVSTIRGTGIRVVVSEAGDCYSETYQIESSSFDFSSPISTTITGNQLVINNLTPGMYTVTRPAQNMTLSTQEITESPEITITSDVENILCFNGNNGSIDLTVSGGRGPYSYSWSNNATSQDLSNLTAGDYNVTVTDVNGCTETLNFTITQPNEISVAVDKDDVFCSGLSTGRIDLMISGGAAPYQVRWTDGMRGVSRSNLIAGTYEANIFDANGCIQNVQIQITQPAPIIISSSVSDILCFGESNGGIDLSVTGGVAPYSYSWSNGESSEDLDQIIAGTYEVSVTDQNGCLTVSTIQVSQPNELTGQLSQNLDIDCDNGIIAERVNLSMRGGIPPYTYNWDGTSTQLNSNTYYTSGTHGVIVTDANGCQITIPFQTDIPPLGVSDMSVRGTLDPQGEYTLNTPVIFELIRDDNIVSWEWDLGDSKKSSEETIEHFYEDVGQYEVILMATDNNGCTTEHRVNLIVDLGFEVIMPTAFTPDNNNLNDKIYPEYYGIETLELFIYNKWGEAVFESKNIEERGWDGLIDNQEAPPGGYAYKLKAKSISGKNIEQAGSFLLVRR